MIKLDDSVGRGGRNLPEDCLIVEGLLMQGLGTLPSNKNEVGRSGEQLARVIEDYQRKHGFQATKPGLISPGDLTWQSFSRFFSLPKATGSAGLSNDDYLDAARALGCEVEAVLAVAKVESGGKAFLPSGRPTLRLEAHVFSRPDETNHAYDDAAPDISSRTRNDALVKGGEVEYERLQKAMCLDRDAALESASYGKFQVMGFNYHMCGHTSVDAFVSSMFQSEKSQLDAFVFFIWKSGLAKQLLQHQWSAFARTYNGPQFGNYDTEIKNAYEKARDLVKTHEFERFLRMEGLGLA